MVGILVSFWDGLFSGAMLVSGGVGLYFPTWTLDPVEIFTYVQNKFFFSTNGRIFVFYDCLRSGLLGRIEVISRKFSNLGIRSEYVLFAFNLRSFCILLHSGVNQT